MNYKITLLNKVNKVNESKLLNIRLKERTELNIVNILINFFYLI